MQIIQLEETVKQQLLFTIRSFSKCLLTTAQHIIIRHPPNWDRLSKAGSVNMWFGKIVAANAASFSKRLKARGFYTVKATRICMCFIWKGRIYRNKDHDLYRRDVASCVQHIFNTNCYTDGLLIEYAWDNYMRKKVGEGLWTTLYTS